MKFFELARLVLLNLAANRAKVILTSLGVMVGAATIVLVLAIGKGGQAEVAEQFKNLSAGAVDISYEKASTSSSGKGSMSLDMGSIAMAMPSAPSFSGGSTQAQSSSGDGFSFGGGSFSFGGGSDMMSRMFSQNDENITLSSDDVEELSLFVPDTDTVTISATGKTEVSGGILEEAAQYTIAGVQSNYAQVSNLSLQAGEFLTDENNDEKQRVCVLGASIAKEIFGNAYSAYDSVIYIDSRRYVVNGILDTMGSVTSGISPDDTIFLPFDTAKKYVLGSSISPIITIVASDVKNVSEVMTNAETVLARTYPNATFTITDAGSKMQAATQSADTLATLLTAVAMIVFIVGGIGIMNVLFVSVKERTGEIGVLKAVGCSRRDILLEFLCEAGMISVFGGIVGVGASFALLPIVSAAGMRVVSSIDGCVLAIIFALATGTIFGFYPAWKASRLVPVEALRESE